MQINAQSNKNEQTNLDILNIQIIINNIILGINRFRIINDNLVPYGLKPIARSMSWIVEQIVVQNVKKQSDEYSISVDLPQTNVDLYDCLIRINQIKYFVNIKTSLTSTDCGNYDVSKAEKLLDWYNSDMDLVLLLAVVKIQLDGTDVIFKNVSVSNVAWLSDLYYNKSNHNLQSSMNGKKTVRTNQDFIDLLYGKITNNIRLPTQGIMDNFI